MNTAQIIGFINTPTAITEQDGALLNELIVQFPYFQTAHLLLAKNYRNSGHFRFLQALKTAAVYAPNKSVLFELMSPGFQKGNNISITESKATDIVENKPISETTSAPENSELSNLYATHKSALALLEERLNAIGKKDIVANPNHIEEPTVASTSIALPIENIIDIEREAIYAVEITALEKLSQEEIVQKEPSVKEKQNEIHAFTEWLAGGASVKNTETQQEQGSAKVKVNQLAILEQFIKNEPRITPAKAQFYSPTNMARKSVSDNDEIVSETLAKIYVAQGNYQRAMKVYEKLGLLYPEKNSLFATLIKELNEKIKE